MAAPPRPARLVAVDAGCHAARGCTYSTAWRGGSFEQAADQGRTQCEIPAQNSNQPRVTPMPCAKSCEGSREDRPFSLGCIEWVGRARAMAGAEGRPAGRVVNGGAQPGHSRAGPKIPPRRKHRRRFPERGSLQWSPAPPPSDRPALHQRGGAGRVYAPTRRCTRRERQPRESKARPGRRGPAASWASRRLARGCHTEV